VSVEEEMPETLKKVREQYRRIYTVTLAPTTMNIIDALRLYKDAIELHATRYQIIMERYGYRYRRMENFMSELGLWKTGEGWLHPKILTKIYFKYTGRSPFTIEIYVRHLVPEWLIHKHDKEVCEEFCHAMIEECEWYWTLGVGEVEVGTDEEIGWGYTHCCTQTLDVDCVYWKGKTIYDRATVKVKLANYVLHGYKVCPEVRNWEIIK